MRTAPLLALALAGLARPAAAELSVRSQVSATRVGLEDQLQLVLTVSGGAVNDVPAPALHNLRIAGGPYVSTQVSFVNGVVSQSQQHTYVLQPMAEGKAEVGPVHVKAGAEEKTAPAITIEVVPGSLGARPPAAAADPVDPWGGEDPFERFFGRRRGRPGPAPKLFIEAVASRNRAHVGEPVLLTYYVYTQTNITDWRSSESPKYAGFWSEELPRPSHAPGGEPVTVEGEAYRRFPLHQRLLFPTRAGALSIAPFTMQIAVARQSGLFGLGPDSAVVERSTKPISITAVAIPEEPAFSGAVGHFGVTASLDRPVVGLGEAATLRFAVEGSGNLKWVDRAPEVSLPGAKVYPPQVKSQLQTTPSGITGTKTWEFILVPETSGTLSVPALTFTYFDPSQGQLTHTSTQPLTLEVAGGAPGTSAAPAPAPSGTRAGGALALRSDLDRPRVLLPPVGARGLLGTIALGLLIHGVLFAGAWWRERSRGAEGRPARNRNVKRALADLRRAGRDGMSKEASVALIEKTLHDVFGTLPETPGVPETQRERAARDVLQDVYFIRYAPQLGDYSEKIQEVARRAAEVVQRWA